MFTSDTAEITRPTIYVARTTCQQRAIAHEYTDDKKANSIRIVFSMIIFSLDVTVMCRTLFVTMNNKQQIFMFDSNTL
jgi:hypothetical protein